MTRPKIFVSYSHKDNQALQRLQSFLKPLERDGLIEVFIDDEDINLGEDWEKKIIEAIDTATAAVLFISQHFLASDFIHNKELPPILDRKEMGKLTVLPVFLRVSDVKNCEKLARLQGIGTPDKPLLDRNPQERERLYLKLTKRIRELINRPNPPLLGSLKYMPNPLDPRIELIGRSAQIKRLETIYQNNRPAVLCVHGPVGSGKTFLMCTFINNIVSRHDGAIPFWWSFPSKESPNSPPIGSTEFFAHALPALGHKDKLPTTEEERWQRLAELLRQHKSLLVLDQVENLQIPIAEHGEIPGKITDNPLRILLCDLAQGGLDNGGIVLVGSRYPLVDLTFTFKRTGGYGEIELKPLEDSSGEKFLRKQGVNGSSKDLVKVSRQMDDNPLALLLVGSLLRKEFNGNVLALQRLTSLFRNAVGGTHAEKALAVYDRYLSPDEKAFLRLLGLFGRKMEEDDLKVLLKSTAGESLDRLSSDERNKMYSNLSDYKLLSGKDEETNRWDKWDTHPLVRHYFGEQLRESDPKAWHDAHRVLFEHYRKRAEGFGKSPNLGELTDMFGVVRHGCLAEEYADAYQFYRDKIAQDWKGYDTEVVGAVSEALIAVSSFFEDSSYQKSVEGLEDLDKTWLLARASYCLESQGKLEEAVEPREASNRIYERLYSVAPETSCEAFERARDVAFGAEELAGIQRRLGELEAAEKTARDAVLWANKATECESRARAADTWDEPRNEPGHMPPVPSWLRQCSTLSALGAVLRRRGKLEEAWEEFEKALEIHNKHLPQEVLHSEPGVRYCTLQLDRAKTEGEYEEVLRHANKMLDWSKKSGSPNATEIIEGLHWLTKSRALTELRRYDEALRTLNEAVRLVEHSNKIQFLCGALLARAAVQRLSDNLDGASADVIEVLRISGECNMKLYQADGHLLRGHIALDLIDAKRKAQASKDLEEARRLIGSENDGNCYRLRIAELHLLAARIEHYRNARKEVVQQCLNEAYRSFNNIGYWRLYRQWQCYKNGCWRR